jgi:predicted O-linked N-acetylglucosamine transferase (SPINDLY family)
MNESDLRKRLTENPGDVLARLRWHAYLVDQRRYVDAEQLMAEGIRLDPNDWRLQYAYGESLLDLDAIDRAVAAFRQALLLHPEHPDVLASLGGALLRQEAYTEAAEVLRRAIEKLPSDALVHELLGEALAGSADLREAVAAYERAWQLGHQSQAIAFFCANAHCDLQAFASAVAWFQAGLSMGSDEPMPWHNFGKALFELGAVAEASQAFERAWQQGSLPSLRELAVICPGNPHQSTAEILAIRRQYAGEVQMDGTSWVPRSASIAPTARVRVGYISSFFAHPNYMKPVYALLAAHHAERVDIELFHDGPPSAELEKHVENSAVSHVFDVSQLTNSRLVEVIRQRDLDVVVDLNAYSAMNRLPIYTVPLARKTIGWFNHYATSGLPAIDVLVGDSQTYDDQDACSFSERVVQLPLSYLAFRVDHPAPDVVPPPCSRLPWITLGSLCSQYKITPDVLQLWGEILQQLPDSQLILANRTLQSPDVAEYVRSQLVRQGVSLDRVELRGGASHAEYLQNYNDIDIALDAWPYNGGTTTTEAMWQGVPVACFRGDRWASRTSASLVAESPFAEFLFDSAEAMKDGILAFARDPGAAERLSQLRLNARDALRASLVCDIDRLASSLETVYRTVLDAQ